MRLHFIDPNDPDLFRRRKRLVEQFERVDSSHAEVLNGRLLKLNPKDELSRLFWNLSTHSRTQLLAILERKIREHRNRLPSSIHSPPIATIPKEPSYKPLWRDADRSIGKLEELTKNANPKILLDDWGYVKLKDRTGKIIVVPQEEFCSTNYGPNQSQTPITYSANKSYLDSWQLLCSMILKPVVVSSPGISIELWDAPYGETAQERVKGWLYFHQADIKTHERKFHIDRRAIAGAIAWEALENIWSTQMFGAARFIGAGKVHFKENYSSEGLPISKQIEDINLLPKQNQTDRKKILQTPNGSIEYIAAIMRALSDIAFQSGYLLDCNPGILTTLFNSMDLYTAKAHFKNKKYPAELNPNQMGTWVIGSLDWIEDIIGKPNEEFCGRN